MEDKVELHLPKINLPNLKLTNFNNPLPKPKNLVSASISTELPTHENIKITRLQTQDELENIKNVVPPVAQ